MVTAEITLSSMDSKEAWPNIMELTMIVADVASSITSIMVSQSRPRLGQRS
jgi:hypothetical protein